MFNILGWIFTFVVVILIYIFISKIKMFNRTGRTITFEPEGKHVPDEVKEFLNNLSNKWNDSTEFEKMTETNRRNAHIPSFEEESDEMTVKVIHIYVPKEAYRALKALQKRAGVSSEQELIGKAFAFLGLGYTVLDSGRKIVALDVEGHSYDEIDF